MEALMPVTSANPLESFQWQRQPKAEALVRGVVNEFLSDNTMAAKFARRMKEETGTRFVDWNDHLRLPDSGQVRQSLHEAGYTERRLDPELVGQTFGHEGGIFPNIVLGGRRGVGIKVESVTDFC